MIIYRYLKDNNIEFESKGRVVLKELTYEEFNDNKRDYSFDELLMISYLKMVETIKKIDGEKK